MVLSPYKNAFTNIFSKVIDLRRREDKKRKSDDQDEEDLVPQSQPKKQKPNPPCRQCHGLRLQGTKLPECARKREPTAAPDRLQSM